MTTRRDVLTGLGALPLAASLPALPARPLSIHEKLVAFYDASETPYAGPCDPWPSAADFLAYMERIEAGA